MSNDKHLKEIVERLLKQDRRCRTDTKWLTYRTMRYFTRIYIPFQDFLKIPSFESIARCKRDTMNKEGKFNEEFIEEEGVTYEKPQKVNRSGIVFKFPSMNYEPTNEELGIKKMEVTKLKKEKV